MKKLIKKIVNKKIIDFLKKKINLLSKYKEYKMLKNINGLPKNFDGAVYLKLNPDVKKAGHDPIKHFLEHGRIEKRIWHELSESKSLRKEDKFLKDSYWQWIKENDPDFLKGRELSIFEESKKYKRTEVINKILSKKSNDTVYLEIGVRNPEDNFYSVKSSLKYSVDPGLEVKTNKADFKLTSDEFFKQLRAGKILSKDCRFDVIFIDGDHKDPTVSSDIFNSLKIISKEGFIIIDDIIDKSGNVNNNYDSRAAYNYIEQLKKEGIIDFFLFPKRSIFPYNTNIMRKYVALIKKN